MSTILEVAKHAGVSMGTVSNVLRGTARVSPVLRQRVATAIRELEYYPGRVAIHVKVKQTCMLGMILPDITNPFFPEIMRGAEDRAFERGYLLVTANTDEQLERELQIVSALRSRRVDGILLAAAAGSDARHIHAAMEAGIHVVCLDRAATGVDTDAVLLDNVRGSQRCVRHLIHEGHRDIAVITGPLELQSANERVQGFRDALKEAKIECRREWIFEGDYRRESGCRLGKRIARLRNRPSAVFVCNGVMTLGVLEALEDMGIRCPEDIAIATFDDLPGGSTLHRRLTTVVQPSYEIGSRAASILMDRVEGKLTGASLIVRIAPTLSLGESAHAHIGKTVRGAGNRKGTKR
ncbi:MAG TPA: LacI family DNA-binding transcriptional regulator [Terracidiphilus sp.]